MKNVKNSDNYVMLGYDLMTKKVFGDKDDDKPIRILLEIILGIKVYPAIAPSIPPINVASIE